MKHIRLIYLERKEYEYSDKPVIYDFKVDNVDQFFQHLIDKYLEAINNNSEEDMKNENLFTDFYDYFNGQIHYYLTKFGKEFKSETQEENIALIKIIFDKYQERGYGKRFMCKYYLEDDIKVTDLTLKSIKEPFQKASFEKTVEQLLTDKNIAND